MVDCKPANTLIVVNHRLQTIKVTTLANKDQYQRIIGKPIYLSHTRQAIAYAKGVVSSLRHLSQVQHLEEL